jgi:hypothetical protein
LSKATPTETAKALHELLRREPTKIKVDGINPTYAALIPQIQKSFLSEDVDAMQPHVRAVAARAITFTSRAAATPPMVWS